MSAGEERERDLRYYMVNEYLPVLPKLFDMCISLHTFFHNMTFVVFIIKIESTLYKYIS